MDWSTASFATVNRDVAMQDFLKHFSVRNQALAITHMGRVPLTAQEPPFVQFLIRSR
jgi:hypothetical protein